MCRWETATTATGHWNQAFIKVKVKPTSLPVKLLKKELLVQLPYAWPLTHLKAISSIKPSVLQCAMLPHPWLLRQVHRITVAACLSICGLARGLTLQRSWSGGSNALQDTLLAKPHLTHIKKITWDLLRRSQSVLAGKPSWSHPTSTTLLPTLDSAFLLVEMLSVTSSSVTGSY